MAHAVSNKLAALNPGANFNSSEKQAVDGDHITETAQASAIARSETSQLYSTHFTEMCQEEDRTAAGLGFNTAANRHAETLNIDAHRNVRDDPNDAKEQTNKDATTSFNQHRQFFATQFCELRQEMTSQAFADLEEDMAPSLSRSQLLTQVLFGLPTGSADGTNKTNLGDQ